MIGSSRLSKHLHDYNYHTGSNIVGAKLYGKEPVLTCLVVCWKGFSTAGKVSCESTLLPPEGFGAQVHTCCSLQLSTEFWCQNASDFDSATLYSCLLSVAFVQDTHPMTAAHTC